MRTGTIVLILLLLSIRAAAADPPRPAPAPAPDLPPAAREALRFLARNQKDGGWGHFYVPTRRTTGFLKAPPIQDALTRKSDPRGTHFPPTAAATAAAAVAFLEAGQSPDAGEGAKPLRAALEFIRQSTPVVLGGVNVNDPATVERCAVTRTMLNPQVDLALALDALIAYQASSSDPALRAAARGHAELLLARLKGLQQADGSWPLDSKTEGVLVHHEREKAKDLAAGLGVHSYYLTFPRPVPFLGDAYILRTLHVASRAGLAVDRDMLELATLRVAAFHDPQTGDVGGQGEHAFYRAAAAMNLLHQLERAAAPDQAPARRAAFERAQASFFRKLRDVNQPPGGKNDAPRNPLDAGPVKNAAPPGNPLDRAGNPAAPAAAAPRPPLRIPVPVTSVDVTAYFLLIESLRNSTHPDARPVVEGIVDTIARRQSAGTWRDGNTSDALKFHWAAIGGVDTDNPHPVPPGHLLTALCARTLLLPPPPQPPK